MKKNVFILALIFSFALNSSAQDCSSLRKANETYGDGDTFVSWCDIKTKTAYTKCMCEQEKSQKVSAIEQQKLQQQALSKSTEASALYQQAHNLATQANLDKDPSKLDKAKALYQQAIALSNQAKGFIEQAYAGSDASYNRLKNLYLDQYNKQITWATTGIESIAGQKERIKAETNQRPTSSTQNLTNNWTTTKVEETNNSWVENSSTNNNSWNAEKPEGMEKVTKVIRFESIENGDCENKLSLKYIEEGYVDSKDSWVVAPTKLVTITKMRAPYRFTLTTSDCDYDCKQRIAREKEERSRRCNKLLNDKLHSVEEQLKSQGYIVNVINY